MGGGRVALFSSSQGRALRLNSFRKETKIVGRLASGLVHPALWLAGLGLALGSKKMGTIYRRRRDFRNYCLWHVLWHVVSAGLISLTVYLEAASLLERE